MSNSYEKQLERIKKVTGCKTQYQLAEFFGVSQSAVASAHKKKSFSEHYLLILAEKKHIHPEWIRTGCGPQRLIPADFDFTVNAETKAISQLLEEVSTADLAVELYHRAKATEQPSRRKKNILRY